MVTADPSGRSFSRPSEASEGRGTSATRGTATRPHPNIDRCPVVSVVIATHNYAHFLPQAIASLRAQTFEDWECILVDDASTDGTEAVAAGLVREDSRIRYVRNPKNLGEAGSRNHGNSLARGEFIAVLDADDWWVPEKLEAQLEAIRRTPGALLCITGKMDFPSGVEGVPFEREGAADVDRMLHLENRVVHSSVLISREAVEAVGGYDEMLPPAADWDLWLRILHRFGARSLVQVGRPLVHYRFHGSNMVRDWRRLTRQERIVLARSLARGAWGLKNVLGLSEVLTEQILRELWRYQENGLKWSAFRHACLLVSLAPWRRWRWKRLLGVAGRGPRRVESARTDSGPGLPPGS